MWLITDKAWVITVMFVLDILVTNRESISSALVLFFDFLKQ